MPGPIDFNQIMLLRAQNEKLRKGNGRPSLTGAILRRMMQTRPSGSPGPKQSPGGSQGPIPKEPIFTTQPVGKPVIRQPSSGRGPSHTFTKSYQSLAPSHMLAKLPPEIAALVRRYGRS